MVDQTKIMLSQLQTVVELKSELSLAIARGAHHHIPASELCGGQHDPGDGEG